MKSPERSASIAERYWTQRNAALIDSSKRGLRWLPRFTCVNVLQENYRCFQDGTGNTVWVPETDFDPIKAITLKALGYEPVDAITELLEASDAP